MKSVCVVLIALVLIFPLARKVQAGTAIGVLGGVTRMSWDGDTPDKGSYGNLIGFTAGGQIDIDVYRSTTLSLQPSFTQKGTRIAFEVAGQKERVDSVEVQMDYFALPLLVKVETLRGRFYVSGGFELSWLLNARYKTPTEDLDAEIDLNEHDFAVNFGIGYMMPAGPTDIWFELRYSQSLVNIGNEDAAKMDSAIISEPRVKNNGLMLLVGVLYDL